MEGQLPAQEVSPSPVPVSVPLPHIPLFYTSIACKGRNTPVKLTDEGLAQG